MTVQVIISGVLTNEQRQMTYEQLKKDLELELEEKLLQALPNISVIEKQTYQYPYIVIYSATANMENEETLRVEVPGEAK